MNIVSLVNIERILDEVRNNIRGFYISVDGDIKEREFDKEVNGVMYFDVDKIKSEANYDYFEIAYTRDSSVIFICDEEGALKCRFDENGKEMMNNNIIASAIYQKLCNNHNAHLFGDVVICHTSRVY
jgi:hypothetical protein